MGHQGNDRKETDRAIANHPQHTQELENELKAPEDLAAVARAIVASTFQHFPLPVLIRTKLLRGYRRYFTLVRTHPRGTWGHLFWIPPDGWGHSGTLLVGMFDLFC